MPLPQGLDGQWAEVGTAKLAWLWRLRAPLFPRT